MSDNLPRRGLLGGLLAAVAGLFYRASPAPAQAPPPILEPGPVVR